MRPQDLGITLGLHAGEEKIHAADQASEEAINAAEQVKAKQRAALEAEYGDDALFSTPGKNRKFRYVSRVN